MECRTSIHFYSLKKIAIVFISILIKILLLFLCKRIKDIHAYIQIRPFFIQILVTCESFHCSCHFFSQDRKGNHRGFLDLFIRWQGSFSFTERSPKPQDSFTRSWTKRDRRRREGFKRMQIREGCHASALHRLFAKPPRRRAPRRGWGRSPATQTSPPRSGFAVSGSSKTILPLPRHVRVRLGSCGF